MPDQFIGTHARCCLFNRRTHGYSREVLILFMKLLKLGLVVIVVAVAALTGCSSKKTAGTQGPVPSPTPKPTVTETGRIAFQNMYIQAHLWAPDAQGYLEE